MPLLQKSWCLGYNSSFQVISVQHLYLPLQVPLNLLSHEAQVGEQLVQKTNLSFFWAPLKFSRLMGYLRHGLEQQTLFHVVSKFKWGLRILMILFCRRNQCKVQQVFYFTKMSGHALHQCSCRNFMVASLWIFMGLFTIFWHACLL